MNNMQPRYQSDGFRPGSGYWNDNRYQASQPIRNADIFMEAGRLAADYLVSKGLLDPESLPVNDRNREFMGPEREPHFSDYARRSYVDTRISRRGGRRRYDPYGRGYGSEWGSREDGRRRDGRRGPWMATGSSRRYPDSMEDGDDDFVPGYARVHRGRFDARFGSVEQHSKSEVTGESGTEVVAHEVADDTGSKASSSSTRSDSLAAEDEVEGNKADDAAAILNSGGEVKSDASGDSKRNLQEEDVEVQPADGEVNNEMEVLELGASDVIEGEEAIKGSPSDAHTNEPNESKCQEADVSSTLQKQSMEEPKESKYESRECLPGFESSIIPVEVSNQGGSAQYIDDKMEGIETHRDMSPHSFSQATEYCLQDFEKQSSPDTLKFSTDEKMVEGVVDQEKKVGANVDILPKAEPEFHVKLEEERHLVTTSFNLSLMGTPETTEIIDKKHDPILENRKEFPMDVGLSIDNNTSGTDDYNGISVDGKMIPVINLEDVSAMEDDACDLSKLKNSTSCSSLDNFLNQTANADLDGMHDGYSLAFSEFIGTDISGCSSVPGDLNNSQTDTSLRNTQGVHDGDDSIYVSLEEEIPIGLMGVWDQPRQDYGKFF